jgi:hypothetical protein
MTVGFVNFEFNLPQVSLGSNPYVIVAVELAP